ncbi:hypothetical protein [Burkholderia phage FLC9]|nr:hypothetical protein [Burkholderia phage FLC9]
MSTPLVIRYPLDPTGTSTNNLVTGEIQNLTANRNVRAIAPMYGAFYTDSLIVTDTATNQPLTPGTQYYAAEMYELPTARYGKQICAVILITDPTVSNQVSLQYQALGGPYSTSAQAIIQQISNLQLDTRPVAWGDILDRPSEFPPAFHLHDIGDVYGFEYLVHAIDRVRDAIEVGDTAQYDQIYAYIDHVQQTLQAEIDSGNAGLAAHLADFTNPHRVTAAQLSVYTKAQSDAITTPINTTLTNHVANKSNPHQVTVAQLNTYDGPTIDSKIATAVAAVRIPFTPVQQGGGANQGTNKIYLGWDGARLRLQVDSSDLGGMVTYNEMLSNVNNLQNQINARVVIGNPIAYTNIGQSVSFGDVTATGTLYSYHDVWAFWSDERLKTNIQQIENPLEKIRQIMGVIYTHNELAAQLTGCDTSVEHMGLLAQQIFAIAPQLVGPAPFDVDPITGGSISGEHYITIKYDKLVALLVEGIKALDKQTQDHEQRLLQLEG